MLDNLVEKIQNAGLWLGGVGLVALSAWLFPLAKQYFSSPQVAPKSRPVPTIGLTQTASLIKAAEPNVHEPNGWATDLLNALSQHHLPQTKENVCAVIAVADQESGFVANPPVPNLGKIAEKAVIEKINKIPLLSGQAEAFLNRFPDPSNSFMQRIRKAKTEKDLDLAYRDLISGLEKYALQFKMGLLVNNIFARDFIESRNEIDTIGSMQVAVDFAVQYESYRQRGKTLSLEEIYAIRDRLYTREGGLFYGSLLLLGYDSGYDKKIYRFADFNAGRYSSRNAAFQQVIAELLEQAIATDGDLLMYNADGSIASTISGTEKAIRALVQKFGLGLKDWEIRRDLSQEKTMSFNNTATYTTLTKLYKAVKKTPPAYAVIPKIVLHSEKTSRILTTERFATMVNNRYQRCLGQP